MAYDVVSGNVFDIRDTIQRFEELESEKDSLAPEQVADWENQDEFETLQQFLDEVKGYGGDEQWRGDWYPVTFIADSYFEDYAREEAEDLYGKELREARWPFDCIDWKKAADELKMDYASVEIDGATYWYRQS